ncbi:MAG: glycosyltransferase [Pseudomonadota bacterium]
MARAVCVIGPIAPFRGGIARHTTAFAAALAARKDVSVRLVTFRRLYPRRLYPGAQDTDPDSRPPAHLPPAAALLDTLDPRSWRRAVRHILADPPDLAILPAWTFFTAPALGHVARALRRAGVETVMVVHNAEDHEGAAWKRRLTRWALGGADRFITHNRALAGAVAAIRPGAPVTVREHPIYDDYPDPPPGVMTAPEGIDLLSFGLVRPYKGLDLALAALAASGRGDVRLSVVGEFWIPRAEIEAEVARLGLSDRVRITPRYVSDAETAEAFARCHAVLAPYRAATGSGLVALARHYRRPVIASDVAGLAEAVSHGKDGWLFPAGDAGALARLIETELSREAIAAMAPALEARRVALGWPAFAEAALLSPSADPHPDGRRAP